MCIRIQPCAQVKLIVVDSIAFHFRQDFQDMAQRTRVLAEMAQKLMHLAEEKDLAVSFCIHLSLFLLYTASVCQIQVAGCTEDVCLSCHCVPKKTELAL